MPAVDTSSIPYLPHSRKRGYYTLIAQRCRDNGTPYDRRHISNILNGRVGYSSKSLPAIARACGVDVQWLVDYIEYVKTLNSKGSSNNDKS